MCTRFFPCLLDFLTGSNTVNFCSCIRRIFSNRSPDIQLETYIFLEINGGNRVSPHLSFKELEQKRDYYKEHSNVSLYRYLIKLGRNKRSAFGKQIKNFIDTTKASGETDTVTLMTNIRQFMNDMKNYLIANGGAKFDREVAKARAKAQRTFNLDEILDNVVCEVILIPLKQYLDDVIFKEYSSAVTSVMEHMYFIRDRPLNDMGIRADIKPFSEDEIYLLAKNLYAMQLSELPSEKLKYFLIAVSNIYKFAKSKHTGKKVEICADDFIPLLVWVLANCRTFTAEVEGLYMWFLMNPSLQSGECGYYITSLLCASALLNEPNKIFEEYDESTDQCICGLPSENFKCIFRSQQPSTSRVKNWVSNEDATKKIEVIVIDDFTGLPLGTRVIPIHLNTRTKEVCSELVKKTDIKHPEDFGLFVLLDGKEKLLAGDEHPGVIQESVQKYSNRSSCQFIFKEISKKLTWPFSSKQYES